MLIFKVRGFFFFLLLFLLRKIVGVVFINFVARLFLKLHKVKNILNDHIMNWSNFSPNFKLI